MNIPFFEANPTILDELRAMDHGSRDYRKTLRKIMMEIGGPYVLLNLLKERAETVRYRRQYFVRFALTGVCMLAMFAWIFVAVAVIGDKEIAQFGATETAVFAAFLIAEVLTIGAEFYFAFSGPRALLQGLSVLADGYVPGAATTSGQTLSSYKFVGAKVNKTLLVLIVAMSVLLSAGVPLLNAALAGVSDSHAKTFSAAGLSIVLTEAFQSKESETQTAFYASDGAAVMALKEEFTLLEANGVPTDLSLKDYAQNVIDVYGIDATVGGTEARPTFTYTDTANGKDYTYLVTVYRGSDAYWIVQFVCQTKDFDADRSKFMGWAESVAVS